MTTAQFSSSDLEVIACESVLHEAKCDKACVKSQRYYKPLQAWVIMVLQFKKTLHRNSHKKLTFLHSNA